MTTALLPPAGPRTTEHEVATSTLPYAPLTLSELRERRLEAALDCAARLLAADNVPEDEQGCVDRAREAAREYRALRDAALARSAR